MATPAHEIMQKRYVQHTYGDTGIITEVEMATAPAWGWIKAIVAFPDFPAEVHFGRGMASVQEWLCRNFPVRSPITSSYAQ